MSEFIKRTVQLFSVVRLLVANGLSITNTRQLPITRSIIVVPMDKFSIFNSPPFYSFPFMPEGPTEDVFCKNCKFFVKDRLNGDRSAKCSRYSFIREEDKNDLYLVTGEMNEPKFYLKYCIDLRRYKHLCGEEGFGYDEKI